MSTNSAGTVQLDLELNSKNFNKQMVGMKKLAMKAGATLAAAFSVRAIANFGKQCLELGSDLTEVQNVVDTVFPTMNEQVNKFAQNAAASFGLSETMAKKYTGTFGAMADAFGFAENESYAMATALTGLAGDVASFYNITQDEAYTKLKSVFTGETETLKELGVVMTQNALDQYALANSYGKTTAAMTEQEKVALRYAFVQDQLSNAAGDFAKTSGSWANQVRYLTLQMESFKASIGQGLINILTPVIQWLNTLMSKLVGAANAFKKFTETLTGKKSQPITLKNASEGVGAIADGASGANNALNKTTNTVKKLKRELAGFDQINKLGDTTSGSSKPSTSGSTGSVSAIDTVDTANEPGKVESLIQKYKSLGKAVDKLKGSFKGFTDVVGKGLKWAYENVLKPLGEWAIKKWLPSKIEFLASAFDLLTAALEVLGPIFKILWDVAKPVVKLLGKFFIAQTKGLTKVFRTFANILRKHVVPFTEKLHKGWKKLLKTAKELPKRIKEIPEKIKEWFAGKIEGAEEWFSGIKDAFFNTLLNLTEGLPDLSGIASAISDGIGEVKAKVSAWFSDKKEDIQEKWANLTADVKEKTVEMKAKIAQKWEDIKEKWVNITGNIQDKTATMYAEVKEKAKGAIDSLRNKWKSIATKTSILTVVATEKVKGAIDSLRIKWVDVKSKTSVLTADIKEKVAGAIDSLKGKWAAITTKTSVLTAEAKEKVKGTLDKLKSGWNTIKKKTATLTGKAVNKSKKTLEALKDGWAAIKNKTVTLKAKVTATVTNLKKWINTNIIGKLNDKLVATGLFKKGPIPKLAQGGYVKKNTPQLAMIGDNRHQGEVIAPERKLEEMALRAAAMAGGGVTPELIAILKDILAVLNALDLNVYLDGKLLKKRIVDLINTNTRATGVCEIIV